VIALLIGIGFAVDFWFRGKPTSEWRWLVQTEDDGTWKVIGEYVDGHECLTEAHTRNLARLARHEAKAGEAREPSFLCYAKEESPDDEESIEKDLERMGYR
jgi:hypothetical protein